MKRALYYCLCATIIFTSGLLVCEGGHFAIKSAFILGWLCGLIYMALPDAYKS